MINDKPIEKMTLWELYRVERDIKKRWQGLASVLLAPVPQPYRHQINEELLQRLFEHGSTRAVLFERQLDGDRQECIKQTREVMERLRPVWEKQGIILQIADPLHHYGVHGSNHVDSSCLERDIGIIFALSTDEPIF